MDRDAVLIYLKNLLDLEFAKQRIDKILKREIDEINNRISSILNSSNHEYAALQKEIKQLKRTNYWEPTISEPCIGILIFGVLMCAASVYMLVCYFADLFNFVVIFDPSSNPPLLIALIGIGVFLFGFLCLLFYFRDYNDLIDHQEEIRLHNELEAKKSEQNKHRIQELQQYWNKTQIKYREKIREQQLLQEQCKDYYTQETKKVEQILTKSYSINLIPFPFHNFDGIAYIYNYMSTSQETLKDALMHAHFENGVLRIEDYQRQIYWQNEEALFVQRCALARMDEMSSNIRIIGNSVDSIQANTQLIQDRSLDILCSCQQNASNSADAARYAQMASSYSEANVYISLANYLKK